jgi:tRNA modification GTPase
MSAPDTIVAIATASGAGGVGVVRVSGPAAASIARALCGKPPRVGRVEYRRLRGADGATLDHGLALFFAAPRSFTGEDVLELHAHGSPVVLRQLVQRCIELGARRARPGEFSERAFLNGKIDLTQAEAIADLIAASSEAQARAALRSLEGEFSHQVTTLQQQLTQLRVHVEAAIDFPEEEVDFLADARIGESLSRLRVDIDTLLIGARQGQRLRDGLHAVIVGKPNAGKSSLMNALAGSERAIVTAVPGTTRDILFETIALDGVDIGLADTAGLRDSEDAIEVEGVRRARAELARADLALLLLDDTTTAQDNALAAECPPSCTRVWIHSKIDLSGAPAKRETDQHGDTHIWLSARSGDGLDLLRAELRARAGAEAANEGGYSARARHVEALTRAQAHLERGAKALAEQHAGELLAEELRLTQQDLGEITGEFRSDDLLGVIFASFCIGK